MVTIECIVGMRDKTWHVDSVVVAGHRRDQRDEAWGRYGMEVLWDRFALLKKEGVEFLTVKRVIDEEEEEQTGEGQGQGEGGGAPESVS